MEVVSLIDAIGRIYNYEQARMNRAAWWRRLLGAIGRGVNRCMMRCRSRSSNSRTKKHPSLKRSLCRYFHPCSIYYILMSCFVAAYITPDHQRPGMAIAMLASPAFFDATRPIFVENWGDWALVSVGHSWIYIRSMLIAYLWRSFSLLSHRP
jgi:hypothetical protein